MGKFFSTTLRPSVVYHGVGFAVSAFFLYIAIASRSVVKDSASAWENTISVISGLGSNWTSVVFGTAGILVLIASLLPWGWIISKYRKSDAPKLAFSTDPAAVAKREQAMKRVVAAAENARKTLGQSLSMPMGPQEFITSLVNASAPADQQLRLPTTREKRDAAISLGGLRGAKALIEDLIDAIPTSLPDLARGAWEHWLQRADSQLSSLLKPKKKNEIMKHLRSIDVAKYCRPSSLAGPRNEALPYLRGIINNLTEDDLRKAQPTS